MKKLSLFIYNTIIVTSTSLFLNIISIIFNIYLSNLLSNEIIGTYSLLLSIHYFAVTITTFGINFSITKVISEELSKNNIAITNSYRNKSEENLKLLNHPSIRFNLNQIIKLGLILSLLFSIITAFLEIIFSKQIISIYLHDKIKVIPIYICSLSLPFIAISNVFVGYFSGTRKALKISICRLLEELSQFTLIIILIKSFNINENIYLILSLALLISEIISALSLTFLFFKSLRSNFEVNITLLNNIKNSNINFNKKETQKTYLKRILHISLPIGLTSIIRSSLSTLKQFLIPMGLKKYGMNINLALSNYGIISGIAMPLLLFPNIIIISISNLLIPEFSQFIIKKDYYNINNIINKVFSKSFTFSIILVGFFITFSDKISFFLYPNKNYNEISLYLKLLSPLIFFIYNDNIIDNILKGLNKQVIVMLTNIFDLLISIILIYILIPKIGVLGYIIILFFSELLNFTISFFELQHDTKFIFNFKNYFFMPLILVSITSILTFLISKYILNTFYINNSFKLINLFLGILIYFFILFYLNKIVNLYYNKKKI